MHNRHSKVIANNFRFGPTYKVSFSASIGLLAGAILSIAATWYLVSKQDRRDQLREEEELEVPAQRQ